MKKRIMAAILCVLTVFSVCACDSEGGINIGNLGNKPATPPSISTLAAFDDLDVILKDDYKITQEKIYEYFNKILCTADAGLVRVKDRDVVQAGDVVQMDYTGYLNDKAFDGGAALNQMVDVETSVSIDVKPYNNESITVPQLTAVILSLVLMILIPVIMLIVGIVVVVLRRKK